MALCDVAEIQRFAEGCFQAVHLGQARIRKLIDRYDLRGQCTIFDSVPQPEVARIVGDSETYVLLSRREGANRALYEALFCDTPVVVYAGHRGVDTDMVRSGVGALFDARGLGEAIVSVLKNPGAYRPLEWARANSGFANSTDALNAILQEMARRRGSPWTRDIVPKKNTPEIRYAREQDRLQMEPEYALIAQHLR